MATKVPLKECIQWKDRSSPSLLKAFNNCIPSVRNGSFSAGHSAQDCQFILNLNV